MGGYTITSHLSSSGQSDILTFFYHEGFPPLNLLVKGQENG